MLVNDLEAYDEGGRLQHRLVVTDVATGSWTPVHSGTDGNNAAWSPNGKWLAFDRSVGFEQYPPFPMCFACDLSVRVASLDGTTRLVVRDALDPEWAPTSTRFVFNRPTSDGVWTVDLDGNETPPGRPRAHTLVVAQRSLDRLLKDRKPVEDPGDVRRSSERERRPTD